MHQHYCQSALWRPKPPSLSSTLPTVQGPLKTRSETPLVLATVNSRKSFFQFPLSCLTDFSSTPIGRKYGDRCQQPTRPSSRQWPQSSCLLLTKPSKLTRKAFFQQWSAVRAKGTPRMEAQSQIDVPEPPSTDLEKKALKHLNFQNAFTPLQHLLRKGWRAGETLCVS